MTYFVLLSDVLHCKVSPSTNAYYHCSFHTRWENPYLKVIKLGYSAWEFLLQFYSILFDCHFTFPSTSFVYASSPHFSMLASEFQEIGIGSKKLVSRYEIPLTRFQSTDVCFLAICIQLVPDCEVTSRVQINEPSFPSSSTSLIKTKVSLAIYNECLSSGTLWQSLLY
jgi:hypothetical protein